MKKPMIVAVAMGLAAASQASWTLIDNFDSYSTGAVDTVTSTWDGNPAATANATIAADATSGNNLRALGNGTDWLGADTDLSSAYGSDFSLADGATATYFFQVMREGSGNDCMLGLASTPGFITETKAYEDYSVMPFVAGNDLRVRNGGGDVVVTAMTQDEWYNVWLVVNNATDTFDMYWSTGTDNGTLFQNNMLFSNRPGTSDDNVSLAAFGISNVKTSGVRVDNLYMDTGANTTFAIPEPATIGMIGMVGIGLIVVRRFRM